MNELFVLRGVTTLPKKQEVKVLDIGLSMFEVRTSAGQECWVLSNMPGRADQAGR
jgi:hypothetical protein